MYVQYQSFITFLAQYTTGLNARKEHIASEDIQFVTLSFVDFVLDEVSISFSALIK